MSALLPLYRDLSRVDVRYGRRTSFWFDCWLSCGVVATAFPALFFHTTDSEVTVYRVRATGLDWVMVPRLISAGAAERIALLDLVNADPALDGADERRLPLCSDGHGRLVTGSAYALSRLGGVRAPHTEFIWGARAPPRVRFFGWLLV